ncbi:DEAD-box ATP-dependent RNA helicase [Raphidocelis subcapitata]|uniref:DEAD-box ATP-dependent RNA helicase n=1 Tax=Raphidocelis subcapitata TaxID=307507 RepID=A0A2V0PAI8_9CHLO|nr:DEAD-box ATP-dependent RNA helicase [Raphidocelis subcapitata]|eukprot:GBF95962.1 DEAD-box ATP-dependent RNA helicase [Raphidocelis subcapitata]
MASLFSCGRPLGLLAAGAPPPGRQPLVRAAAAPASRGARRGADERRGSGRGRGRGGGGGGAPSAGDPALAAFQRVLSRGGGGDGGDDDSDDNGGFDAAGRGAAAGSDDARPRPRPPAPAAGDGPGRRQRLFDASQSRERRGADGGGGGGRGRGRGRDDAGRGLRPRREQDAPPQRQPPLPPPPPPPPLPEIPIIRSDAGPDKGTFYSGSGWRELGASDAVVAALQSLGITRPSHAESYRAMRNPAVRHVALADQAGSGKTLAYLLPLLQALVEEEAAAGRPCTAPGSPRLLVVAPTVELAQQVQRVLRALVAGGLRFRTALMTGGQAEDDRRSKALRTQEAALKAGVDVAIATPGRAVALLQRGTLTLAATKAVVLDEIDVLAGGEETYREQVEPLQAAAPMTTRFVLVSATLPAHTFQSLREAFPGVTPAFGPGLHRVAAGVTEELVDCSGGDEISLETGVQRKLEALTDALERHRARRAIVFCNKLEACRAVENYLRRSHGAGGEGDDAPFMTSAERVRERRRVRRQGERGDEPPADESDFGGGGGGGGAGSGGGGGGGNRLVVEVHAYHEAVKEDTRAASLAAFLSPDPPSPAPSASAAPAPARPPVVLVCTDRTSRGIDTAYCEHVVLFDFPRDPSEYVRRAGRTARGAGGRGVVSVLVLGKQVPLARDIIDQNQKGRPVHRVPGLEDARW